MAADRSRGWACLSDNVLYGIFRRVPCEVDRLHAGRVCHSWRAALAKLNLPAPHPPVPWLLLPETDEHGLTFSCVLSECRTHPFFLPHSARRTRYFGSYDGAWIFLAVDGQGDEAQDHVLVNLHSFQFLDLPNAIPVFCFEKDLENIAIVAATLSRPPTEQGCIVAGIIELSLSPVRRIAFWRMGDRMVSHRFWAVWPPEEVEDLLYYNDGGVECFLFLTQEEDVRVCAEPNFHEANVQLFSNLSRFKPRGSDGQPVLARYLVQSRGVVLMVVRLGSPIQHEPAASEFRVFERKYLNDGKFRNIWSGLSELDGRMLFVGRGCSRSYEATDGYPGMEGVYFLDDRSFDEPIFHDPDHAYRCGDNSKWSEAAIRLDRCFPERGQSKYSPPALVSSAENCS
ncbi:hypothetical protein E2562_010002 [Oryza meyeriana var. granulata]|uniref:KIB1-4 beta-propeller domain-containing protein n=1 Tax=Oryza meyeriana var. granulata TaxID=110450 RepID=A0A6G1EIR9_9ORYZ|nr:hypothetical protein E2562_010002 [Oryza meyeriana var. granulata]